MNQLILKLADKNKNYLIETKQYLHKFPELSGKELKTKMFLCEEIKKTGLSPIPVSETGFLAVLDTNRPGKNIVLRADLDALPIEENSYNLIKKKKVISNNPGVCHACGHDAHMAILLTSIKILTKIKDELKGKIIFCFEEGEETGSGIEQMMQALNKYSPDFVWALHVQSSIESGIISITPGPTMAGVAGIDMDIIGKSGHSSRPDLCINPLFGASQVINLLASSFINNVNPESPVTLGISNIHGGTAPNIIPNKVNLKGTLRFFDINEGEKALDLVNQVSSLAAKSQKCKIKFNSNHGIHTNCVYNNEAYSNIAIESIANILGESNISSGFKWYSSESFSHYTNKYPGVLAFLGIKNEKLGSGAEHHNEKFDIDDNSLINGLIATVKIATDILNME